MPFLNVDSTRLFYRLEGKAELPLLVLSHSLGCDHDMWAPQMPDLLRHFRVLRYDTRGHGASAVPPGDYTLEQFGRDALALADAVQVEKFAWCGLSMGGAIGQWLALHAPERLTHLVLANTAAKFGTPEMWEARRKAAIEGGMAALVDLTMQRFFSPEMVAAGDLYVQSERAVFLGMDPAGYLGCCAALRDVNHLAVLAKIRVPTLVIGSDADPSTPWADAGSILARDIPGAKSVVLPGAHLSNLARPRSFTAAVLEFLLGQNDPAKDPFEEGLRVRREVLGHEHVDRSLAQAGDLTRDFQWLITRYAWGAVWNRPALDPRTRRLLVLAITAAMSRWEEFRLHLRAALRHGMEPCDIRETLLQTAIYGGVPAANTGFHILTDEIERLKTGT